MEDLYGFMKMSPDTKQEDVTRAYRQAAKIYHPDHGGSSELFTKLSKVYDTLSDPVYRKLYDDDLESMARWSEQRAEERKVEAEAQAQATKAEEAERQKKLPSIHVGGVPPGEGRFKRLLSKGKAFAFPLISGAVAVAPCIMKAAAMGDYHFGHGYSLMDPVLGTMTVAAVVGIPAAGVAGLFQKAVKTFTKKPRTSDSVVNGAVWGSCAVAAAVFYGIAYDAVLHAGFNKARMRAFWQDKLKISETKTVEKKQNLSSTDRQIQKAYNTVLQQRSPKMG